MTETKIYATGDAGRRLVHVIFKKPRAARYRIERIDSKGNSLGCDIGGRTLQSTLRISESILQAQRYMNISRTP